MDTAHLIDTSVFVAFEQDRPVSITPPGDGRISVMTLTELGVGLRRARDDDSRHAREATLASARQFIALAFDERVSDQLVGILSAAGARTRRAGLADAIIAATALAHDLAVWTQDDDFDVLQELAPELRLVRA